MTETHILEALGGFHPEIHAPPTHQVTQWQKFWHCIVAELPQMYKNKENWIYPHYAATKASGNPQCCAGDDKQLEKEFANLKAQGLEECDDTAANNKNFYILLSHPDRSSFLLKCEFKFKRFLGKQEGDEPPKGAGLCPILFGAGVLGDGFTYVNVKFSVVRKSAYKGFVGYKMAAK